MHFIKCQFSCDILSVNLQETKFPIIKLQGVVNNLTWEDYENWGLYNELDLELCLLNTSEIIEW
jgi:hypothetical protein